MSNSDTGVREVVQRAYKHLGLPSTVAYSLQDETPKNVRKYDSSMEEETRLGLERLYEAYNRNLGDLLYWDNNNGKWDNPWPYSIKDMR